MLDPRNNPPNLPHRPEIFCTRTARLGFWLLLGSLCAGHVSPAAVLAVEPCPPIQAGPGRVVTGTFAHESADVLDLHVAGLDEPVGVTAAHPFWSDDRQDFVPAGMLRPGERLAGLDAPARVASIVPRASPQRVYNLEVDVEHVYYVTPRGLLVHNQYIPKAYRGIIVGNPHLTRTAGHAKAIAKKAIQMAKTGRYDKIYVNKGVNGILGKKFAFNRRPDIVAIPRKGGVHLIEAMSKSDMEKSLMARLMEIKKQLPSRMPVLTEVIGAVK